MDTTHLCETPWKEEDEDEEEEEDEEKEENVAVELESLEIEGSNRTGRKSMRPITV